MLFPQPQTINKYFSSDHHQQPISMDVEIVLFYSNSSDCYMCGFCLETRTVLYE